MIFIIHPQKSNENKKNSKINKKKRQKVSFDRYSLKEILHLNKFPKLSIKRVAKSLKDRRVRFTAPPLNSGGSFFFGHSCHLTLMMLCGQSTKNGYVTPTVEKAFHVRLITFPRVHEQRSLRVAS
ncbi:hypothetical protein TNCV_4573921 [Trichonephila clavipes]|nr:hypothetical protein TNCV_4573921 [Trichonephila clavipes]